MAALGDHRNVIDECLLITLAGSKPPDWLYFTIFI